MTDKKEELKHTKIGGSREENAGYMNQILPVQESFDLVKRDLLIGGRMATFYFIDGFTKDEVMLKVDRDSLCGGRGAGRF